MRLLTFLFVFMAISGQGLLLAQGNQALLDEIRDSLDALQPANFSWRDTILEKDGAPAQRKGRFAAADGCSLDIQGQSDGTQRARVRNPDYWFEARRLGEHQEWVLSAYAVGEFPAKFDKEWNVFALPNRYPSASLTLRLIELLNSDNVSVCIVSHDEATNEAELAIEIIDPASPVTTDGMVARFKSANIKLRKMGAWAIIEYRQESLHGGIDKGVNEDWIDCGEGMMMPLKWSGTINGVPCESFRSDLTLGPLTDTKEFTLEAFGLPVPGNVSTGWAISYYWLGAIGVLLLVIAGWMQFRAVQ